MHGLIAALVVGIVIGVMVIILAVRTSFIAEENLQAFFAAHRATIEYVERNNGDWPRSWADLSSVRPETDFDRVADHVTFDFDADPAEIARQTPETFSAIVPHDPCYAIDYEVQWLIETVKKYHGTKEHATEHTDEREPG
jgi:hypothetical protein